MKSEGPIPGKYVIPAPAVPQIAQPQLVHPGNWVAWLGVALAGGVVLAATPIGALLYLGLLALNAWQRWAGQGALAFAFGVLGVALGLLPEQLPQQLPSGLHQVSAWLTAPTRPTTRGSSGIIRLEDSDVRLLVAFPEPAATVPAGALLTLTGTVDSLPAWMNASYRRYLRQQGVHQRMVVQTVQVQQAMPGLLPWFARLRHHAGLVLDSSLHGGTRIGLARALLLGDRSLLDRDTRSTFQVTGTMHLVAVSGSHLSLLLVLLWAVLRPAGLHLYQHRRWQAPLLVLILGGYGVLTGWEAPVVRAVLMAALLLLGRALHRHPTGWNLWGASLLLMLASAPKAVFDPALQLSFAAVAGLLFGVPRVQAAAAHRWQWLGLPLATTVIATLAILPLQLLLFGQLPVYTVIANALMSPLAALSLAMGLLLLLCHGVPLLGFALAACTALLLDLQLWLAAWMSQWPGAALAIEPTPWTLGCVLGGLGLLVWYAYRTWPATRRPFLWV